MQKGPVSQFIQHHYRHFNAAALIDAAKGYETHLAEGGKMLVSLAGAMSTAELGISLAEMIRQDKVAIISCTGANLEEDVMNLVAHSHKAYPTTATQPQGRMEPLENHYNRVTDTVSLKKKLADNSISSGNAEAKVNAISTNTCTDAAERCAGTAMN